MESHKGALDQRNAQDWRQKACDGEHHDALAESLRSATRCPGWTIQGEREGDEDREALMAV